MREKLLILDGQGKIGQECKIKERGKIFTGKIVTFGKTCLSAKMICTLIFLFTLYSTQERKKKLNLLKNSICLESTLLIF